MLVLWWSLVEEGVFLMIRIVAAAAGVALVTVLAADLKASDRWQTLRPSPHFWTEDRLRDAEPMPLPQIDPGLVEGGQSTDLGIEEMRSSEPSEGEPGALPDEDVHDELWQHLYEPADDDADEALKMLDDEDPEFESMSQSPTRALYTQSRILAPAMVMRHHPYSTIGKLFFRDPRDGSTFVCSGSVIQLGLVATAGHCVYNAEGGYFFGDFLFVPAFVRGAAPLGEWKPQHALVTGEWVNGGDQVPNPADVALLMMRGFHMIRLTPCTNANDPNCLRIGNVTGWLGWQTNMVHVANVTMFGYPGNLDNGQAPQQTNAQSFQLIAPNSVLFGSGMGGGSSGGPYVLNFGRAAAGQFPEPRNRVVGIMSFGNIDDRIAGTSILNHSFVRLFDAACRAGPTFCRTPGS